MKRMISLLVIFVLIPLGCYAQETQPFLYAKPILMHGAEWNMTIEQVKQVEADLPYEEVNYGKPVALQYDLKSFVDKKSDLYVPLQTTIEGFRSVYRNGTWNYVFDNNILICAGFVLDCRNNPYAYSKTPDLSDLFSELVYTFNNNYGRRYNCFVLRGNCMTWFGDDGYAVDQINKIIKWNGDGTVLINDSKHSYAFWIGNSFKSDIDATHFPTVAALCDSELDTIALYLFDPDYYQTIPPIGY